jgi:hypothetical protein
MSNDIDTVPHDVREFIVSIVKRVDTNEDGKLSYYEFLYVITQMKFNNMATISDQDIHSTKTGILLGLDVERLPLSCGVCVDWLARLYNLKNQPTISITIEEGKTPTTTEYEDPWIEARKRMDTSADEQDEPDPLAHLRKDTYSEIEWDVESMVNKWDLDKLVDEVFGQEGLLRSIDTDLFTTSTDTTFADDEFTEHFEEFKKERRRKRDIVLGVIRTIIRNDSKKTQQIAGNSQFTITIDTAEPGTPTTPGSRRKALKEKVIQKLRRNSLTIEPVQHLKTNVIV